MDGGVWDGKRLVIPCTYSIPLAITTQTTLDKTGFSVENCSNFMSFVDESSKILDNASYAALDTANEAVMFPIRNINGGVTAHIDDAVAVRNNSKNLQNAYHFIKILLSPECMSSAIGNSASSFPAWLATVFPNSVFPEKRPYSFL